MFGLVSLPCSNSGSQMTNVSEGYRGIHLYYFISSFLSFFLFTFSTFLPTSALLPFSFHFGPEHKSFSSPSPSPSFLSPSPSISFPRRAKDLPASSTFYLSLSPAFNSSLFLTSSLPLFHGSPKPLPLPFPTRPKQ